MARIAYLRTLGPDPDPNGVYVHFAIDFFGMAVPVAVANFFWRNFREKVK